MSIQTVERAADRVASARQDTEQATADLRRECSHAIDAGVPLAAVARAAGVTRTTMYEWLRETK